MTFASGQMMSKRFSTLLSLPAGLRSLAIHSRASFPTPPTPPAATRSFSASHRQYNAELDNSTASRESSVNHAEVSHFNALASSWWDPQGSSRLLHLMNPLRHDFIRRCLERDSRNIDERLRYLDIGCGGGIFAESAARLPNTQSVTAIDPSPEVIAVAKQHRRQDPLLLEKGRLSYENIAIEDLSLPSSPGSGHDIVTLFEVIEHIHRPSPFLQSCIKHLKPGGWLIGSTIARTNVSWFTTKFMAEDVLGVVPKGTHDWNQYIQPHELRNWARAQPELDVDFHGWQIMGVLYVPGVGWKEVPSSEDWGNYFFGIRKGGLDA